MIARVKRHLSLLLRQSSLSIVRPFVLSMTRTTMTIPGIKNMGLRKRGLPKVLILKIHRPDLHCGSLNRVNVTPRHSPIVRSVPKDTIQVARSTVTVPPGALYAHLRCTVNWGLVVILIFCRESTAIMKRQPISSSSLTKYNRNKGKIKYFTALQMIPHRKWSSDRKRSPNWTANDLFGKRGMAWNLFLGSWFHFSWLKESWKNDACAYTTSILNANSIRPIFLRRKV